jgi:hypothetical protein
MQNTIAPDFPGHGLMHGTFVISISHEPIYKSGVLFQEQSNNHANICFQLVNIFEKQASGTL